MPMRQMAMMHNSDIRYLLLSPVKTILSL